MRPKKFNPENLRKVKPISGIYMITGPDKCRYIGQASICRTSNVQKRLKTHLSMLVSATASHHNNHLQNAWNLYGADAFTFQILCEAPADQLDEAEQHWTDYYKARKSGVYNISPIAGSQRGFRHSEKTKAEYSRQRRGNQHALGNRHTPEFIDRFRKSVSKPQSEEHKEKRRQFKTEWWRDPARDAQRAAIAERNRSTVWTPARRTKLSNAMKRRAPTLWTDEMRAKLSAAQKKRWAKVRAAKAGK